MTLSSLNWLHQRRHVIAIVLLAATASACGIAAVTTSHRIADLERRLCAEQLKSLRARNRFVEHFDRHADPCTAIRVVASEDR